jgi:hypothetical protein
MQEVLAQKMEFACDALLDLRIELKIAEHLQMDIEKLFGIATRVGAAPGFKGASNRQQAISDALHRGYDYHDLSIEGRIAYEIRGVQHAFGS